MSQQLMAVVAEGKRGRVYSSPTEEHVAIAEQGTPEWEPTAELSTHPQYMAPPRYGMTKYADLFTKRQLVALTVFSDLASEVRVHVEKAVRSLNVPEHAAGSRDAKGYADAVATYLAFALDKGANYWSSLCAWHTGAEKMISTFSRQVYPMVWDFTEPNPFSNSSGNVMLGVEQAAEMVEHVPSGIAGNVEQLDAVSATNAVSYPVISTDPPYYDNVPYADLSDFFYVWLRRSLGDIYPSLFSTVLAPKAQELVADQRRHGGRKEAQRFFENGLNEFFARMRREANPSYPITIYYAFKQVESEGNGDGTQSVASTGWETMLEGLLQASFQITGTWPVRTELTGNLKKKLNVLAASIVLVCRPRPAETPPATRQEFVRALRRELPDALSVMMAENVAPVDLAQATIGPGMAIYSRYSKVVEADGSPMRVRTALQIINQSLDEHLSEAEGDVDRDTRFALTWFEQRGMESGPYGEAETIATARGISVRGVQDAGILEAKGGKARLLRRDELTEGWDPKTDERLTDWEIAQYLIRALETEGETGAARLLARVGERGESARDLAYRLYGICERKKWAGEALAYNGLVVSWPEITRLASQNPEGTEPQTSMEL